MKRLMTKKVATIGVIATVLVGGAAAFAIVTGVGTGSGGGAGAAAGPGACPVTLTANWDPPGTIGPPAPGPAGATATIDFSAKNLGTQPCLVKTISANVVSLVGPVSSSVANCQSVIDEQQSQFWLTPATGTGSTSTTNVSVPQNGGSGVMVPNNGLATPLPAPGTLHWVNEGFDQGPCLSQPLNLAIVTP